jgi:hypothetical protein
MGYYDRHMGVPVCIWEIRHVRGSRADQRCRPFLGSGILTVCLGPLAFDGVESSASQSTSVS